MSRHEKAFTVPVEGSGPVSARRTDAGAVDRGWTFIYAPGAGANIDDPFGAFAARELPDRGVSVVRFQFPYMEAKRRSPDRPALLEATWRAVIDAMSGESARLVVGGRSMGGRIASQVVAQGVAVDALALFAYPLHPPGKPDQQRVEHLGKVRVPALFCSGTRDAFASEQELGAAVKQVRGAKLHMLEGADHGFAVPKSSDRSREDVWAEAIGVMADWLRDLK